MGERLATCAALHERWNKRASSLSFPLRQRLTILEAKPFTPLLRAGGELLEYFLECQVRYRNLRHRLHA